MTSAAPGANTPVERAVLAAVPFLAVGLVASLPLLFIRWSAPPLRLVLFHLTVLVLLGFVASLRLAPLAGRDWFEGQPWTPYGRMLASGAAVVFLVTGSVGLVAIASSAALRYPPSLQFLQLLSALDIAWAGAALVVGVYRVWRTPAAIAAGLMLTVICIWSIWWYLDGVGFGPNGEWIVDASYLMQRVLPFDVAAAVMAVGALLYGTHRQAIEQARPQS